MTTPSQDVVDAIEAGTSQITRRVEFYESDNETRWYPDGDEGSRLIDGNVTVDYNRAERRALDNLVLDNRDNALRQDPTSGLWYDKIIKCYRGVTVPSDPLPPKIAIIETPNSTIAQQVKAAFQQIGFTRVTIKTAAVTYGEVKEYDIIVSYMTTGATAKSQLLKDAYAAGKAVWTSGIANSATTIPLIATTTTTAAINTWGIIPPVYDTPLAGGWGNETASGSTAVGQRIDTVMVGTTLVAFMDISSTQYPSGLIQENGTGGRWFHVQSYSLGTQHKNFYKNALRWLWNYTPYKDWEIQIGEFLIDSISEANFPHQTKIVGRDFTKKCLNSKLKTSMSFEAGTPTVALIRALAANAGITKFRLPDLTTTIPNRMDFERGTERWSVMQQAAASINCELYMSNDGYLTLRPFFDPSFGPLAWTYKTGADGNLSSWERSTNDSRLYNIVVITGDPTEADGLPFYGEASNTEPSSPTRIERIGERPYFYNSSFFTSNEQCVALANQWLKVKALETYEISWSSFVYPWAEVGEIVAFLDPLRAVWDPTRYLLDTLNVPLGLGPMSATGKRVTFVNDPNATPTETEEPV